MSNYNHTLEFDKIKQRLYDLAATDTARQKINELAPILNELKLQRALNETNDARLVIDSNGSPQIPNVTEAEMILSIAEKGGLLLPERFDTFVRFIASCRRLKAYLKQAEKTGTSLAYLGGNLDTLDELYKEINRCISGNDIDSNASKQLANVRRQIENLNMQIKGKLDELMRSKKQYCNDSFISIKNGHHTIPVKKEYKNQVPGSVIAVSSTGTTCFIEPSAVTRFSEKLGVLDIEETIEKEKILYSLTALLHQYEAQIKLNIETVEALDFAFAKGRLSSEMKAAAPKINTSRQIRIEKGRHPLLNSDNCVPLDFEIGGETNGIVITGPNTGGKTVALKTVGLFCLMAQCGLHLPCQSADICMNSNILCDIGDGQNISENLSTFSSHITNIIRILENTGTETLVLLDELGSGTDPAEGMGIAIAILEELRQRSCLFVATTHYAEVKKYAQNAQRLTNARMTFDRETLKPLYQLVIGEAGESCAFYIAKKLGFPSHLLDFAFEQTYSESPSLSLKKEQGKPVTLKKIEKTEKKKEQPAHAFSFQMGDSVTVLPENKIGIVYKPVDENGMLIVQIQGKKQKINHKRLKLKAPASQLYPPDYDFSILFDSVENRKARHQMDRKFSPEAEIIFEEERYE